ncbi:hypothetical protein BU14_0014s0110 [Porphyra umbilicalis]|uniref:Uncharacterized protein n=1 Tax=Porphyra umbilicalis TaxID=2786 RepID=A0A1X6PL32_PORUM|nr:hypothetical protein BU14_0014s0110 [Porphyra umbilicalis]|eukprot:OSX81561.1 hypothetical protein BU14_0014s0110 [Porphyra umbilicalis]
MVAINGRGQRARRRPRVQSRPPSSVALVGGARALRRPPGSGRHCQLTLDAMRAPVRHPTLDHHRRNGIDKVDRISQGQVQPENFSWIVRFHTADVVGTYQQAKNRFRMNAIKVISWTHHSYGKPQ